MLLTTSDFIGLVASYAYATVLLVLAEALRRWCGLPSELTRKLIHIGAGMWVFGVLALFHRWESGIVPFATFIFIGNLRETLPFQGREGIVRKACRKGAALFDNLTETKR